MSTRAILKNRKNCLDLSGERIDYSVHRSSCALHNAVPDILGCHRRALCHVGCPVDGASLHAANGDGDCENDRKECSHGTKVSLPPARVRLPFFTAMYVGTIVRPRESTVETQPQLQPTLLRLSAMISHYFRTARSLKNERNPRRRRLWGSFNKVRR